MITTARAAVVMHEYPVPLEIYDDLFGVHHMFDIDSNGSIDFTIGTSVSGTALRTERGNRAVIKLVNPPTIGGRVVPVGVGYEIASTLAPPSFGTWQWASSDFLGGYVSPDESAFTTIVYVSSGGSASNFSGRGQIGLEFEAADGLHYGYFDIDAGPGYSGIKLYGWAYETTPNTPIIAGALPEPSRTMLFLLGILSLLHRRRRALGSG